MTKKVYSVMVIMLTIIYVSITLYFSGTETAEILLKKPSELIGEIKIFAVSQLSVMRKPPEITYDEVKQNSSVKAEAVQQNKKYKFDPLIIKLPKATKDSKLERMHLYERELLVSLFNKTDVDKYLAESVKNVPVSNYNDELVQEKQATPVFNTINKENRKLSDEERDKLQAAAKRLSSMDQEKINKYLESGYEDDIVSAINLLRDRLSDKEYEGIKAIAEKYSKK